MKCKCCKCFEQIETEEQVKFNNSVYCQPCCEKQRRGGLIFQTILVIIFLFVAVSYIWTKKDNCQTYCNDE